MNPRSRLDSAIRDRLQERVVVVLGGAGVRGGVGEHGTIERVAPAVLRVLLAA